MRNPFRYFNRSPEVIRLTVMMYIRYPLSLELGKIRLHSVSRSIACL
jgi:putative transposase